MSARKISGRKIVHHCIAAALFAVMLISVPVSADGGRKGDGKRERRMQRVFAEHGITEEQQARLKEIRAKTAPTMRVHQKQVELVRAKIKQELQKEKPSKSALNKYAAEMGNLHKQMNLTAIDNLLQIKAVLTHEQFAALSAKDIVDDGSDSMRMLGPPKAPPPGFDGRHPKEKYKSQNKRPKREHDPGRGGSSPKSESGGFVESSVAEEVTPPPQEQVIPAPPVGATPDDSTDGVEGRE